MCGQTNKVISKQQALLKVTSNTIALFTKYSRVLPLLNPKCWLSARVS